MTRENHEAAHAIAVRRGTGTRHSGRTSAQRILASAHALLAGGDHEQFSMRNVAARAGLHLANVQYYFATRDDLICALFEDIGHRYREAYRQCLASARPERRARFDTVLAFNFQDIGRRSTRHYFIQLWALLDRLDGNTGRRLSELYAIDIAQLSERIAEIDPRAGRSVVRRRATLLAAMIEGLMIVQGAHSAMERERRALMREARRLGFAIALGHDPRRKA